MSEVQYTAPIGDMRLVLERLIQLDDLSKLPGYEEATPEMVSAVLDEAAKLSATALAPLNRKGDAQHARWSDGKVATPDGFKEAYAEYRDGGWNSLPFDPEYGGQGLPWAVAFAVQEMLHAANMSFGLCPMLNQSAVELLEGHGSKEQKDLYLSKLISGEWTGTMNLTEPQAGSDLGPVSTKAVVAPELGEDVYRISGQKIYITYGEHDLAENIVHLVLARTPDAKEGTKGLGLFLVPKILVNEDGSLGEANDVKCVSIESKMGINASPTCTMAFGDEGEGAVGYLVGKDPQAGIRLMFIMMNNARLGVGLQGVAIGQRAYEQAVAYAKDRVQSKNVSDPKGPAVTIIDHPDVRRMLMTMRALTEAGRALVYSAGAALDHSKKNPDPAVRAASQMKVDLLTPIAKAWCTDNGVAIASLGVQVHGGMGFVEETGAAQHYRDARIAPIYEGTNGIQAADLAFRKVGRDEGVAARAFFAEVRSSIEGELASEAVLASSLRNALESLEKATQWVARSARSEPAEVGAVSRTFLEMWGLFAGGHYLFRSAVLAKDTDLAAAKLATATFYAKHLLPQVKAYEVAVVESGESVLSLPVEAY